MLSTGTFLGPVEKHQQGCPKLMVWGWGEEAKTTVQPVSRDDSASEKSVQVVSPPSISLHSPQTVPHLIYDNQPNRVGSKLSCDKPLGRFIPSPNRTFFNKESQQQFDELAFSARH